MTSGPLGREGCSRPGFLACCSFDKRPLASLAIVGSLVFSSRMPHHSAVPLCSSNSKTSPGLSFHKFPSDPATRAIWVRNIRRDEAGGVFVVNSSSRVCGLHFVETDYHDGGRQRERQTTRQNRMLKQGSVPTKFNCFPERLRRPADDGKNKRKAPKERKEPPPKKRKEPPTSSEAGGSAPSLSVDTKESAGSAAPSSEPTSTGTSSTDDRHDHCECVEQLMDELARLDLHIGVEQRKCWEHQAATGVGEREAASRFLSGPLQGRRWQDPVLHWFHHFWDADGLLQFFVALGHGDAYVAGKENC